VSDFDVLVDLTPLWTLSRFQGIGTYVRELERSLARLPADELHGLKLGGLVGFERGRPRVEPLLEDRIFDGADVTVRATSRRRVWQRRLLLGWALRSSGARLVHLPEPLGMPLGSGVPRVVTCHDLIPLHFPEWYLSRRFPLARPRRWLHDRVRFGSARRVLANSQATARDLIETLGISESRVDVTYPGVDFERFRPEAAPHEREDLRARFGIDRPFLLFVGAGDPRKGISSLIRAHARVAASHDVLLVLAGRIDPLYQPTLDRAINEFGRGDLIRRLDFVPADALPALYRQCLVFSLPSHAEGFGLPLAEAMACGAPAVVSSVGSLPEVAGDAALLVPPGDDNALATQITRVVEDLPLGRHLADRGPIVASRFSWARCARDTLASYRRALGLPAGTPAKNDATGSSATVR
jgi:glycosyltransferase involved in cell wall biosynthesis